MRHRLRSHDTPKTWLIGHACDLPSDGIKATHDYRQEVVKVVCNTAGKLTDGLKLLRLAQRCFGLVPTRDFLRYTLFQRRIEMLKFQGRSGHVFTRAIKCCRKMRCVSRGIPGRTLARQSHMNPRFSFQQFD